MTTINTSTQKLRSLTDGGISKPRNHTQDIFRELGIKYDNTLVQINPSELTRPYYHTRQPIEGRIKSLFDSLNDYGFLGGIFVSASNNHVIDGWYRKKIWEALGHFSIPCFKINCTEEQEKILHLKLNTQVATFDFTDFGLSFPGLNLVEDFGFTMADLHVNQPILQESKYQKALTNTKLMKFNTLLLPKQYERLKAFKQENALENWSDVIDMLLTKYEAR